MTRTRTCPTVTTLRFPKPLRRSIDEMLVDDGRSFAEATRSLWATAIAERRRQKAMALTASK